MSPASGVEDALEFAPTAEPPGGWQGMRGH